MDDKKFLKINRNERQSTEHREAERKLSSYPAFPLPDENSNENTNQLKIDIAGELIKNPAASFLLRVEGHAHLNVHHEDMLIVDRSLKWKDGDLIVCVLDGHLVLKILRKDALGYYVENPEISIDDAEKLRIHPDEDALVWGVVSAVIHKMH